jgi:acyl-coenzyme A synthetase/AMP-(fatty) acid ligase
VVGLRADYSFSAVAAFFALLAHGLIPALIPRDRSVAEYLKHSCAYGLLEVETDGTHRYTRVARPSPVHPLLEELPARGDAGFVVFTSGSTGAPKATLHSLERFLGKFARRGRSLRTLAFLLFDHIAGLDTVFYTLRNGGTLVLANRRDPNSILRILAAHNVEVLPTSPSFLRLLCATADTAQFDLSSLKIITYGSEPMDPLTLKRLGDRFPSVQLLQKYGTTELGSPQTVSRSNDSLWIKFKEGGPAVKVVDGVLWLRSEGTMLGYINAPGPDTSSGWYCTGDLVEVDGEWLRFLGRADDVIKVGGEKVSPSEVEHVIRELDFVRDAAVTGESHPLMGQIVIAQVAIAHGAPLRNAAAAVRQHCRRRLGPHHVPVKVTLVPEDSLHVLGYRLKVQRLSVQTKPASHPES